MDVLRFLEGFLAGIVTRIGAYVWVRMRSSARVVDYVVGFLIGLGIGTLVAYLIFERIMNLNSAPKSIVLIVATAFGYAVADLAIRFRGKDGSEGGG